MLSSEFSLHEATFLKTDDVRRKASIICKMEKITIDVFKYLTIQIVRIKVCSAVWITFRAKYTNGSFPGVS